MHVTVVEPRPGGRLADMIRDGLRALGRDLGVLPLGAQTCLGHLLPLETVLTVLSVNSMPEVELARQIAHFYREVPLILVSESPEYGMEGFRLGAVDYLLEPLSPDDVAKALKRGLWVKEWCDEIGGDLPQRRTP